MQTEVDAFITRELRDSIRLIRSAKARTMTGNDVRLPESDKNRGISDSEDDVRNRQFPRDAFSPENVANVEKAWDLIQR